MPHKQLFCNRNSATFTTKNLLLRHSYRRGYINWLADPHSRILQHIIQYFVQPVLPQQAEKAMVLTVALKFFILSLFFVNLSFFKYTQIIVKYF